METDHGYRNQINKHRKHPSHLGAADGLAGFGALMALIPKGSAKVKVVRAFQDGDNYIQHNPHIADKLSGLGAALEAMGKRGITMKYGKIHKVLGEGNFVLAASEGVFAGKPTSFYDLFRVENGKIAEHWDTMETIPAKSEWKNTNGKF